jgi:hypothetical protein
LAGRNISVGVLRVRDEESDSRRNISDGRVLAVSQLSTRFVARIRLMPETTRHGTSSVEHSPTPIFSCGERRQRREAVRDGNIFAVFLTCSEAAARARLLRWRRGEDAV